jgi:Tol biopolymer transport system component
LIGLLLLAPLAYPQIAGTIVFNHAPDGGPPWPVIDIYSMTAQGIQALTKDGHSHNPSWSPGGRRILFIHDAALTTKPEYRDTKESESYHPVELYVMNRDGSNLRLLRRLEPVIFDAAWSPDGRTVAITYLPEAWTKLPNTTGEPTPPGLFLLASDGHGEPRLLFRNAYTPAWSPDGKKLAFSSQQPQGRWTVGVANADGSEKIQLTDAGAIAGSPAWSPDGRMIAFDEFVDEGRIQQIFVMNANGSGVRQITTDSSWSCEHPSWSPDAKQLAFSCRSASTPCGVVSSVGSLLPECARRIFAISPSGLKAKPVLLSEHDGSSPTFAPIR